MLLGKATDLEELVTISVKQRLGLTVSGLYQNWIVIKNK